MPENEKFQVGQEVLIHSVNARGREPERGIVTRVGRKLVYVEQWGREFAYRADEGGTRNNSYGHEWIETPARAEARARREAIMARLRELGVEPCRASGGLGRYSIESLEQVVSILEEQA